ncbi:hypothetical protein ACJX0J_009163, partial [Zea mays]
TLEYGYVGFIYISIILDRSMLYIHALLLPCLCTENIAHLLYGLCSTKDTKFLYIYIFIILYNILHIDAVGVGVKLLITIFCAGDYKYTKNNVEDISVVEMFLQEVGLDEGQKDEIVAIIKGMGFKNEVSNKSIVEPTLEFAIVQDADRLDAIGAIGIARCFTYGGSKNSALHDPRILPRDSLSKEKYMSKEEKQTSINHFHEKLFKLKDMMKTE